MKAIIDDLLFDTDKSQKLYQYREKRKVSSFGDLNFYEWFNVDVYKTKKENFFIHGYVKDNPTYKQFIERINEKDFKRTLKKLNVDKYLELYGDEIKEG